MSAFTLDGRTYNVRVPAGGIRRSGQVLDGENAGRTPSGVMIRDIIGTYYNYSITIDAKATSPEEYDAFYEAITAPVESHQLRVPYGQAVLTFQAYVTSAEDTLDRISDGVNRWGGLTVNFVAMAPARQPAV